MEDTGTVFGVVMCQICFPSRFDGEKSSVWLAEACDEMVTASNPGGGW